MSTWYKASEPPQLLETWSTSDNIIIYTDYCQYLLGFYYSGKDGQFYISNGELVRNVTGWTYLPKYDLEDKDEDN